MAGIPSIIVIDEESMSVKQSYLIVSGHFFNPLESGGWDDITQGALCFDEEGRIASFGTFEKVSAQYRLGKYCELIDYSEFLIIPAFVDVHLHAPQFNCRGYYSDNLLEWLDNFIFTEEEKFASSAYANNIATELYKEMASYGIGTASIYGSVHPNATDILFAKGAKTSMKLAIGKVMMDRSEYETTAESLSQSLELYQKWDGKNGGRLRYSFTPRFAPSCTEKLLEEVGKIVSTENALCQTHLSETPGELELVKKLFLGYRNYTEVYSKNKLLKEGSIVAHSIYLDDDEYRILKESGSGVAHCPDSNMFLHSGKMDLNRMLVMKIPIGLGSDIGAGSTLSPFNSMKMMIYAHGKSDITPEMAFYLATLGGAKVIGFGDITGNFSIGKDADFIVMRKPNKVPADGNYTRQVLSHLIFCNGEHHLKAVYLKGERVN
ncbi:MAG: guanine deaminase [candidate division Zixibacteria bacterium CG_4_9_14_3_um_filter_46_8]|nr:MAG: guanine deaminase [candidate division Zixibacteria bacterium CG_4_9_14_3_um_filter_46_8]